MNGWIEAEIVESIRRGRCPICDAVKAGYENYLSWLRSNLQDERFHCSVVESGGYCLLHLRSIIASLRFDPYSGVSLLKVMRSVVLSNGRQASSLGCHLCEYLRSTEEAYFMVINSIDSEGGQTNRGKRFLLCSRHESRARLSDHVSREQNASSGSALFMHRSHETKEFLKSTEVLLNDFHKKDPDSLRWEVERCEALLIRFLADERNGR